MEFIRDGRSPIPESEVTSRVMSSIRGKDTKPELKLRKALRDAGLSGYRLHWKKAPGRPDIAYPGKKIAIFVHGCFWHRCPKCNPPTTKTHKNFWDEKFRKNVERDKKKTEALVNTGWKVFVFWECEIESDLQKCVDQIHEYISNIDY
ncbi:very short patch repair endonuclease [Methanooceanicella nereidis]|nr:very short patch repair endonuclease [Methanocella sp. CWC-04]